MLTSMWDLHVHTGTHTSAQVGGAGRKVSMLFSFLKTQLCVDGIHCITKTLKNWLNIAPHLHTDYPQLVFLIDPYQESLVDVVEDSSSFWPFLVDTCWLQETVSLLKQEVVIYQLLSCCFVHSTKRIVRTFEVTRQWLQHVHDLFLEIDPFLFGHVGCEIVTLQIASNANTSGSNKPSLWIQIRCVHFLWVHVRGMAIYKLVGTVVLLNDGVK